MAFCCKEYNIKVHITTQHGGEGEEAAEESVDERRKPSQYQTLNAQPCAAWSY